MIRFATYLLAGALVCAPGLAAQDEKSPDQQQHSHPENNPSSQAHKPQAGTDQPSNAQTNGQSPDTEQEKSGQRPAKKKTRKNKNNARQVHGTPKPGASTSPQP